MKIRINDQTLNIFIEEEHPVAIAGHCKGSHCNCDSSDSISSTETYVEESTFSVKSDEEECDSRAKEERQSKGKVVGGGKEEGGQVQRSNVRFGELSAENSACWGKGEISFTKEVSQR